jgi:hypothetical protein
MEEHQVVSVTTERSEYGLPDGLRPSSSREAVVRALGETESMAYENRELLAYRCRGLTTRDGYFILGFVLVDDVVEAIGVLHPDMPGMQNQAER